jgi:hypothetical protein
MYEFHTKYECVYKVYIKKVCTDNTSRRSIYAFQFFIFIFLKKLLMTDSSLVLM